MWVSCSLSYKPNQNRYRCQSRFCQFVTDIFRSFDSDGVFSHIWKSLTRTQRFRKLRRCFALESCLWLRRDWYYSDCTSFSAHAIALTCDKEDSWWSRAVSGIAWSNIILFIFIESSQAFSVQCGFVNAFQELVELPAFKYFQTFKYKWKVEMKVPLRRVGGKCKDCMWDNTSGKIVMRWDLV